MTLPFARDSVAFSQIPNHTFAILGNGREDPLEVRYLKHDHQSGQSDTVAVVDGVQLIFDHASIPDNAPNHTNRLDKSSKSLKTLHRFMNFMVPKTRCIANSGIFTLGFRRLVERRETTQGVKVNIFGETKFQFEARNGEGDTSSPPVNDVQFLDIRGSKLKAVDSIENFGSVDISSGICLFSHDKLRCLRSWVLDTSHTAKTIEELGKSKPGLVDTLPTNFGATLYEIESLVRLSNAIANVVVLFPETLRIKVVFDVPRAQYYCHFLDLLCQKHCSIDQFKLWTAIIDQRHDQLTRVLRKAVEEEVWRRGCKQSRVILEESPGLEIVVPEILNTGFSHKDAPIESLITKLRALDPLWRDFFELVDGHPKTLSDLCCLSYVHQLIRPVLQSARTTYDLKAGDSLRQGDSTHFVLPGLSDPSIAGKDARQLLLQIENPLERRTFFQAEKVLLLHNKKHRGVADPLIVGLFPSERVFTESASGSSSLYFEVAEQTPAHARANIVQPMDIVTDVYGHECTDVVRRLLEKEGMVDEDA